MNSDAYNLFISAADNSLKSDSHSDKFRLRKQKDPFVNSDDSATLFKQAYLRTIENLDEELIRFESLASNNGFSVHWASDYNDVFDILKATFKNYKVRSVRLPNINNSTIFRELGIKYFLRDQNIDLVDNADIQFFVADMLFSDTGRLLLLNQSNNSIDKLNNHSPNLFLATVDRLLNDSDLVEIYQNFASYSNGCDSQDMLFFGGSQNSDNHIIIIDNQHSNILHHKSLRQIYACTHCGKCKDVCPVFQSIGDEPYNNVFTGPVANIILPFLESFESCGHLPFACTLCGRCEEVCPIRLPLVDMILDVRHHLYLSDSLDKSHDKSLSSLSKFLSNRASMNRNALLRKMMNANIYSSDYRSSHSSVPLAHDSFNNSYRKKNKSTDE